jgi:hypothetical protein
MAWGYAASAEAIIRAKSWVSFPLLIISTFVLMRFFFAPTKNLYTAAILTHERKHWRWLVFMFDFPLLIFHSYAYYAMSLAVGESGVNAYRFFQWLILLLAFNVVWLLSIAWRMRILGRRTYFKMFIRWSVNNFVSVVLYLLAFTVLYGHPLRFSELFVTKETPLLVSPNTIAYWAFFAIALLNCCVDLILTASDYLGFEH